MDNDLIKIGFLPATALLVAILLVWAQLWVNTYRIYKDSERKDADFIIALALSWTYLAIFFAVAAFACFALGFLPAQSFECLEQAGIGLLGASFSMVVVEVVQSLWSAFRKFWKGKTFDEPAERPLGQCLAKWLLVGLPVCFLGFSMVASFINVWWWIGNPAVIFVTGIVILILRKVVPRGDD